MPRPGPGGPGFGPHGGPRRGFGGPPPLLHLTEDGTEDQATDQAVEAACLALCLSLVWELLESQESHLLFSNNPFGHN